MVCLELLCIAVSLECKCLFQSWVINIVTEAFSHCHRLDTMGALRLRYLANDHQLWRLFTSPCLHAGIFHLIISLSSVVFVGVHLEQEFGPCKSPIKLVLLKQKTRFWCQYDYLSSAPYYILCSKDWSYLHTFSSYGWFGSCLISPR